MPKLGRPKGPGKPHPLPPVENPLANYCLNRLGLTPESIIKLTGLHPRLVYLALLNPQEGAINGYITICNAIGLHFKMRQGAPISIWLDRKHLRSLFLNNSERKRLRIQKHPLTRGKLRQMIRLLKTHRRTKFTYAQSVDYLHKHFICTANGLDIWRDATCAQIYRAGLRQLPTDEQLIVPGPDMLAKWERMLVKRLWGEIVDPMFQARYQVDEIWRDDRVWLVTKAGVPESPRKWFMDAVGSIPWLNGGWGMDEMPPPSPIHQ